MPYEDPTRENLTIGKAEVLKVAPELSEVTDDDAWYQYILFADQELPKGKWPKQKHVDRAGIYLIAHLLTMHGAESGEGTGELKAITVGPIKKEFNVSSAGGTAMTSLDDTAYGREYKRLIRTNPKVRFSVV